MSGLLIFVLWLMAAGMTYQALGDQGECDGCMVLFMVMTWPYFAGILLVQYWNGRGLKA